MDMLRSHDLEFADAYVDASDSPRPERYRAILIAGGFFLLLLGWMSFIPLDAGAFAPAIVTVSGNRQAVQHRDGGIVTALDVKEGQSVRKGQILLTLSSTEMQAQENALATETYALMAQRERLKAERDGQQSISEPPEFAGLKGHYKALADQALADQRRLFLARRSSVAAQLGVLSQRSQQTDQQVNGYRRQMQANLEQRRFLAEELKGQNALQAKGFASLNRIRALERASAQLKGEYGALDAQIARSGGLNGEIAMQSLSVKQDRMKEIAEDLRTVAVQIQENLPKLAAIRERVAQAQVRAPASGKVVGLKVFTVGGVIAAGETVMDIVPQDKELVVSAMISPKDADDLWTGQQAQVRFTGLQERNLPILHGEISRVSADSFANERTGEQYFKAEVKVPKTELAPLAGMRAGRDVIRAGMPAEVLVPLRKRSALAYLIEPLMQSFWRLGREE